jgi:hypothetical protein
MIPHAFYVEGHTVLIPKELVVWEANPVDEVYNQYNRIFGSGIQLAGV